MKLCSFTSFIWRTSNPIGICNFHKERELKPSVCFRSKRQMCCIIFYNISRDICFCITDRWGP